MKKLYRKGTVHPTPPLISDQLSFLPVAILTLTAALSQEDKEVLAYLISCSSGVTNRKTTHNSSAAAGGGSGGGADHLPFFNCYCFSCYMSYWVKWDLSPNRQLIHVIIDAYEDGLQSKKEKSRKDKRNRNKSSGGGSGGGGSGGELKKSSSTELGVKKDESNESESVAEYSGGRVSGGGGDEEGGDVEKGSVRKFVSFVGEKIWSLWT